MLTYCFKIIQIYKSIINNNPPFSKPNKNDPISKIFITNIKKKYL